MNSYEQGVIDGRRTHAEMYSAIVGAIIAIVRDGNSDAAAQILIAARAKVDAVGDHTHNQREPESIRREERERILKLPLPLEERFEGKDDSFRAGYGAAIADWAERMRGTKS